MIVSSLTSWHLIEALLYDPQTLSHLRHPHEIPIITVAIAAHRNVKVNQVIGVIGSGLPDIVLDP